MDSAKTDLFDLAAKRLNWIERRQAVLAQNVANANTPNYQAKDIAPFAQQLSGLAPQMARTDPQHLTGVNSPAANALLRPHERAPDGNAVSVEEELTKIADVQSAQSLTSNLLQKYNSMFRTVLGK